MAINQEERAYRTWPILTELASRKSTISYGELGKVIGVYHRAIRFILKPIQNYCIEANLPPLTILVVNSSGRPGDGFIAHDHDDFEHGLNTVCGKNWAEEENPFGFSQNGDSIASLVTELIHEPASSKDVYSRVKSRGIQQMLFRKALIKAYSSRCAFTEISMLDSLDACHIIPWSRATPEQRLDVRNGILLNKFHHSLFDSGQITITDCYRIVFRAKNKNRKASDIEQELTVKLHGAKMYMPRKKKLRPCPSYINEHHEILRWKASEIKA